MKFYTQKEDIVHKTKNFPLAYYLVSHEHPRYFMMHHWHYEYELVYIKSGKLKLRLDDRNYELSEGSFALISPGVTHSAVPRDCVYECIVFNLENLTGAWKSEDKYIGGLLSHKLRAGEIYTLPSGKPEQKMLSLLKIIRKQKDGFEIEATAAVFSVFYALIECDCIKPNENVGKANQLIPFNKAISFIEQNYDKHITLEAISKHCGICTSYLSRYFKKYSGLSPFDYINHYRVDCAAEMLIYTKKPVTEIALSCGFSDLSYFSKIFRQIKHKTPRQYRNEH